MVFIPYKIQSVPTNKNMTDEENEAWKKGYDLGCKATLLNNQVALALGQAILNALDNRYEFREEDY